MQIIHRFLLIGFTLLGKGALAAPSLPEELNKTKNICCSAQLQLSAGAAISEIDQSEITKKFKIKSAKNDSPFVKKQDGKPVKLFDKIKRIEEREASSLTATFENKIWLMEAVLSDELSFTADIFEPMAQGKVFTLASSSLEQTMNIEGGLNRGARPIALKVVE